VLAILGLEDRIAGDVHERELEAELRVQLGDDLEGTRAEGAVRSVVDDDCRQPRYG